MKKRLRFRVQSVVDEFAGATMPDRRLEGRLAKIARRVAARPAASLPKALGSDAAVEGGYRFLRNPRVKPEAILKPHREQMWLRARTASVLLSVEDTTEARFGGHSLREGLGPVMNEGHGFFLHGALLVGFGELVAPIGVAAHEIVVRDAVPKTRKKNGKRKVPWREAYFDPKKESLRWHRVAAAVDEAASQRALRVVHVCDREADDFALMAECIARGSGFVFRMRDDRRVLTKQGTTSVSKVVARLDGRCEREVLVSERKIGRGMRHRPRQPPRDARRAQLSLSACRVDLARPQHVSSDPIQLAIHVVDVRELNPPAGAEPVSWCLLTTEPIDTLADVERVVDMYRARWLIEELWKALKTGCAFELRQLESRKTLENALAIFLPIAWHMLLLRAVGRDAPHTPADRVLTPAQLKILKLLAHPSRNEWGIRLPETPTASDALYAIARMGGHLRQNGSPGWLTIRRGLDELLHIELAVSLLQGEVGGGKK